MARSRRARLSAKDVPITDASPPHAGVVSEGVRETTGRYLVLLREDGVKAGVAKLKDSVGLKAICHAADFNAQALDVVAADAAEAVELDSLGVAVINAAPDQTMSLAALADGDSPFLAMEPEQVMHALADDPARLGAASLEYLRGYRDAVNTLYAALTGEAATPIAQEIGVARLADSAAFTWGLQATKVSQSRYGGRNVRVAVLDTGMDLNHPDFAGRPIVSQSFINGQAVQDGNGHGTHCIGTALGPQAPAGLVRRYGCAHRGAIFAGKVLSNQGSGADGGILGGINWAIANKCRVISMSLGAPVAPGEPFSPIYEQVAQRALAANTLIVAAAGNESRRPGSVAPVDRPANCPSILAVAALDENLKVPFFSNGGINGNGGGVDIAAPGVNVFSSWPMAARYRTISGTSMATPHVAGIAALWLEARGMTTSARGVWQLLVSNARRLSIPSQDVGAGLVQAPL